MLENKNVSEIIKLIQSKQIPVKEVVEFYIARIKKYNPKLNACLLYTSPSPRDATLSRMPSSA